MSDPIDLLSALGNIGVAEPVHGDPGDTGIRASLQRVIDARPARHAAIGARLPRTGTSAQRRTEGLRQLRGPRLAVAAGLALLAFGGIATGAVLSVEALLPRVSAPTLFRENPQIWNQDNHDHPPPDGLIRSTVTEVETLRIPKMGEIQYWAARTRGGGSCAAFKLPDGSWAGTSRTENLKYNVGGIVPGCHQPNAGAYTTDGGGFYVETNTFGPSPNTDPHAARDFTFVAFGMVKVRGAVRVRDMQTGRTTPIIDRHFFAIERPARNWPNWTFQALDRTGKVLSTSRTQEQMLKAAATSGK